MKHKLMMFFVNELFVMVGPDMIKEILDNVLDPVEVKYADNKAIMLVCDKIRDTWNIPEFDD